MIGDGGDWLRTNTLILASNRNTPVGFWLSLRLSDLPNWIRTNNQIEAQKSGKPLPMTGGEDLDGILENL